MQVAFAVASGGRQFLEILRTAEVTASEKEMRDNEDSKTIAQVSQEASFSAEVGKG